MCYFISCGGTQSDGTQRKGTQTDGTTLCSQTGALTGALICTLTGARAGALTGIYAGAEMGNPHTDPGKPHPYPPPAASSHPSHVPSRHDATNVH